VFWQPGSGSSGIHLAGTDGAGAVWVPHSHLALRVHCKIVKIFQAWFISADLGMYYAETDMPARARTSNLNEELGQVDTIPERQDRHPHLQPEWSSSSVLHWRNGLRARHQRRWRGQRPKRMGIPLSQLDDYDPDEEDTALLHGEGTEEDSEGNLQSYSQHGKGKSEGLCPQGASLLWVSGTAGASFLVHADVVVHA